MRWGSESPPAEACSRTTLLDLLIRRQCRLHQRPRYLLAGLPGWLSLTRVVCRCCALLYGQNQATSAWARPRHTCCARACRCCRWRRCSVSATPPVPRFAVRRAAGRELTAVPERTKSAIAWGGRYETVVVHAQRSGQRLQVHIGSERRVLHCHGKWWPPGSFRRTGNLVVVILVVKRDIYVLPGLMVFKRQIFLHDEERGTTIAESRRLEQYSFGNVDASLGQLLWPHHDSSNKCWAVTPWKTHQLPMERPEFGRGNKVDYLVVRLAHRCGQFFRTEI